MKLRLKGILILLLIQFSLQAQVKQEIGIVLGSVHQSTSYSKAKYNFSTLNQFTYKHYDGNSIFRFSAKVKIDKNNLNKDFSVQNIKNKLADVVLKFGLEKQFPNKIITPYFATDLILLKLKSFQYESLIDVSFISDLSQRQNQYGYGISPIVGFKIAITKKISLNMETSLELIHLINRNNLGRSSNKSILNNIDIYYNPINLFSFNVNL